MKAIGFQQANTVLGAHQAEYDPLPCYRNNEGEVLVCFEPTWRERLRLLFGAKLWYRQQTFRHPFHPVALTLDDPWKAQAVRVAAGDRRANV